MWVKIEKLPDRRITVAGQMDGASPKQEIRLDREQAEKLILALQTALRSETFKMEFQT